jgi:hypothetical protein
MMIKPAAKQRATTLINMAMSAVYIFRLAGGAGGIDRMKRKMQYL